jgi:hypothetical protein
MGPPSNKAAKKPAAKMIAKKKSIKKTAERACTSNIYKVQKQVHARSTRRAAVNFAPPLTFTSHVLPMQLASKGWIEAERGENAPLLESAKPLTGGELSAKTTPCDQNGRSTRSQRRIGVSASTDRGRACAASAGDVGANMDADTASKFLRKALSLGIVLLVVHLHLLCLTSLGPILPVRRHTSQAKPRVHIYWCGAV